MPGRRARPDESRVQKFLLPDDSQQRPARDESEATFAEMYRMLALPQMPGDVAGRAVVLLDRRILISQVVSLKCRSAVSSVTSICAFCRWPE
jgi:hypothetical protein